MIDTSTGIIEFICDACDEKLPTSADRQEWAEANRQRAVAGWKAQKFGDVWEHFCPECRMD